MAIFFTFVDRVKTNKDMFEFFSPSGSHTILVYRSYTDTKHHLCYFFSVCWFLLNKVIIVIHCHLHSSLHSCLMCWQWLSWLRYHNESDFICYFERFSMFSKGSVGVKILIPGRGFGGSNEKKFSRLAIARHDPPPCNTPLIFTLQVAEIKRAHCIHDNCD